ncbi:MAG: DUF86 domain-containing protein [Acidobacteriota bacterium]|nr:DUF86 domain-containing protein [Acidobacteriota bacterium]
MNPLEQLERDARLWHVERAASAIVRYTQGRTAADFATDELLQSAVERQLILIGEALARAVKADPDIAAAIESTHAIIALRNRLVHNYPATDWQRIWEIATGDLPILLARVRSLLPSS